MYITVEAGVNMTYCVTEYFVKGHTCVMHVSNREREEVVSVSRTANDR
jgi:hypothetical protein